MPVTIGTLTSHVNITDNPNGQPNPAEFEQLVKMVAMRLKDMKKSGDDDDDGTIPDRRTDP